MIVDRLSVFVFARVFFFPEKLVAVLLSPLTQLIPCCNSVVTLNLKVPDITGTDYVDPMTTSMDGIEDLPANEEAQVE